jgi:hypothetical protein
MRVYFRMLNNEAKRKEAISCFVTVSSVQLVLLGIEL